MAYSTFYTRVKERLAWLLTFMAIAALVSLFSLPAAAQFDTGTISGSVTDSSGAVIPHATVTVTNVGTGLKKSLQSDSGGNYTVSALPFGTYVVSASAGNFAEAKSQEIVLNVGATVHVNLSMNIAAAEQVIEVTGTTNTVDTASTTAGTTLNATQIANLPVNGRDVSNFLEIAPGSVNSTGFFQGSINGLENIFTGLNVTVDGQNATRGDINGFLNTEGQEGARVTRSSLDSIQEISFSNNGYSAEYGHSLGPQMNIVTKTGTNAFHGTLFEFLRNDALDARDYFDRTGPQAPLRLNQFGGNLGGPVIQDKLFFFMNYEGDRTKITSINPVYHVLSASARAGFVDPAMQDMLNQLAPLPAGCDVIPTPASCEYFGDPNFVVLNAKLPTTVREDTGSLRVDYNLSDRDRFMFRYNINDSLTDYTFGLNQGQISPQKLRTQLGKFDYTRTFTPTLLNEFSIGVDRFYSDTNSNTPLNSKAGTSLVGWGGFFTDLGALPGPNSFNQVTPFTTYELFDTVTKTMGSHTLKFGTQDRLNRLNEWLRPQQQYLYANLADLQGSDPFCTPGTNCPFVLQKIGFPGFLGLHNSNWDFYLQDDWRVTRRLTLNLGLRYDYNTVWAEQHGHMQNFDFATQSFLQAGAPAYSAPAHDFAPRVGVAWDPLGRGKTVIHGYGGLFYMPMQMGFGLTTNVPQYSNYNVDLFTAIFSAPPIPIAYPAPNPPIVPSIQNVTIFPTHPRDPVSVNWMFGIQQEVAKDTVLTVNYMGNKVTHMQAGVSFAAINLNPSNPNQSGRTCFAHSGPCAYANENNEPDVLFSTYNSLQAQLRSKIGSKLNFEANYTWSHEIDDLVNVFGGWSDPFNINLDRGSGDWDVRQNLTASAVYSLPELRGANGLERGVLGGWQLSSILQARSGLPTNIQLVSGFFGNPMRPDYTGQPLHTGSANWPNGNYNPAAFEVPPGWNGVWNDPSTIGTVGRNALRGPGFVQLDFSLMKNFAVTEHSTIQFRTDFFNLLNHPNFANPDGGICRAVAPAAGSTPAGCAIDSNTGVPEVNGNFGQSTATVASLSGGAISNGTARQVQFSLKFIF
ncbi:MAG TPA: carboxypeptidase regulatory-like domain-containing protein [Terriglobales bacterium]